MIVVGVTGVPASGKSEVSRAFAKLGARVFDADASARFVSRKGTAIHRAMVKLFGKSFLKKDGALDRKKIAERVFSNPQELKKLQQMIHPGVILDCLQWIKKNADFSGLLVLDVPLLYEARMESIADCVVVVSASRRRIGSRLKQRGLPEALARKILRSQWPLKKKEALADFVLVNNGTLRQLEREVKKVYQLIIGGSK